MAVTTADGKHDSAHQSASPSGQVAGLLGGLPGLGFFTRSISGKIIGPYLLVIFAFAIIVTYAVMRLVAGSLEERYLSQLGDAGRSANESVVRIEQDHLKSLRLMTFTEGVAEAARKATKDAPVEQFNQAKGELEKLLKPHQVNARLDYVEAVGPDGELVNALREGDQAARTPANPKVGTWPITQRVLRGETDQQGDKFSELVLDTAADPEKPDGNPGPIFYTVGPIRDGDQVVGAVLVGTPLEKFVQRLARESLTNVSLYGLQGEVLATTLPPDKDGLAGQAIHQDEFRRLTSPEQIVITRGIDSGNRRYQELLGGLEIRGSRQFVVGVAIPQNAIVQAGEATRNQLILLFSVMVAFVLLVGLIVARIITQPILRLVQAHQRIAAGELGPEVFVEVSTNDETGFLTRTFNDMVEGLRDREKVKDAFGRYTNPALLDAISKGELKLGGERREVSVMMTDIRSFTTISERMAPEELLTFLNDYFGGQISAIVRSGGRIDKFVGDAILAVWGAPIFYEDHPLRAVLAALNMRTALAEFNHRREEEGLFTIRIGMGINSGSVVAGNLGGEEKLEYTVIGDTVNTTARTEELTKEFKHDILITQATYERVADVIQVGPPQLIIVRGRTQATAVYPVIGLRPGVAREALPVSVPEYEPVGQLVAS